MADNTDKMEPTQTDERSPAQFFFEMGFGACYAEAIIRNGDRLPFPISDGFMEHQWEISQEAYEDHAELDAMLARATHSGEGRSYGAGEDAVRKVFAAWDRHCDALTRTNAAIPEIDATPAERAVYDERYRASEEAKRDWYAAMHTIVNDPAARALATLTPKSDGMRDATQSYLCPTPWCSREDAPHIWQGVNDKYYVTCPSCGVNGPDADDDTDAWDKWCWRGVDDKPKPVDPVKFVNDLLRAELLAAGATDYAKLVDEPKSLWWMPIVRKAMLATLTPQGDGEIERLEKKFSTLQRDTGGE